MDKAYRRNGRKKFLETSVFARTTPKAKTRKEDVYSKGR